MTWTPREALEADEPLIRLIIEWDETVSAYEHPHETESRIELADKIAALEGQICRHGPNSTNGATMMLDMAHRIATAREIDVDSYVGDGPLARLLHRVRGAMPSDTRVL